VTLQLVGPYNIANALAAAACAYGLGIDNEALAAGLAAGFLSLPAEWAVTLRWVGFGLFVPFAVRRRSLLVWTFFAMLAGAGLGMLIERLAYRPLRGAATLNVLITAIGVSLLLENTGQQVFGATPRPFPELFPTHTYTVGGLYISSSQLVVIGVTLVLLIAVHIAVALSMGTFSWRIH